MNDPGSGSAAVHTVGDSYAEINESSFQMKVNKCYYNVKASSSSDSNKERSPKKRERCPVAIPVLVAASDDDSVSYYRCMCDNRTRTMQV